MYMIIVTYISLFRFGETSLTYDESAHNTILDYVVKVKTLDEYDRIVQYAGTNYSVTGNYSYLEELSCMADNVDFYPG